jgi:hypothetical protein
MLEMWAVKLEVELAVITVSRLIALVDFKFE